MADESRTVEEPKIEELDKLIAKGKQKGFLTYDEVNDALPFGPRLPRSARRHHADVRLDGHRAGGLHQGRCRLPSEIEAQAADRADDDEPSRRRIDLTPGPVGPHRGPGPPLPPRDGQGVPPHPRGRDHARQAHRGGQGRGHRARSSPPASPSRRSAPSATSCARTSSRSRTWWTSRRRSPPRRRKRRCAAPSSASSATSTGSCASGRSSRTRWRRLKAKAGGRKRGKAEPAVEEVEGQAQAKKARVLAIAPRPQPPALPPRLWGQDLKKLVEKIHRAEREIALWSDGRRPAPTAVDAFLSSLADDDRDDGDRDLYQKAASQAPLDQGPAGVGGPAEDQARRGAAPTRAPRSSRTSSRSSRRARPRPRGPRRRWSRPTCGS